MQVRLLRHTENPEELILLAMSKCYDSKPSIKSLRAALKAGHTSLLEHVCFTWEIRHISRVVLAQLTRHRHASYTVRSQRYCDEIDAGYYRPEIDEMDDEQFAVYESYVEKAFEGYELLLELGTRKEIARYVLPQAVDTELILTMNARELYDVFLPLRLSRRAQPEIRELAYLMLDDCCRVAPGIFGASQDWGDNAGSSKPSPAS